MTSLEGYGPKDRISYSVRNDIAFNHIQTHQLILNRTGLRSSVLYSKLESRGKKKIYVNREEKGVQTEI